MSPGCYQGSIAPELCHWPARSCRGGNMDGEALGSRLLRRSFQPVFDPSPRSFTGKSPSGWRRVAPELCAPRTPPPLPILRSFPQSPIASPPPPLPPLDPGRAILDCHCRTGSSRVDKPTASPSPDRMSLICCAHPIPSCSRYIGPTSTSLEARASNSQQQLNNLFSSYRLSPRHPPSGRNHRHHVPRGKGPRALNARQ